MFRLLTAREIQALATRLEYSAASRDRAAFFAYGSADTEVAKQVWGHQMLAWQQASP